MSITRGEGEYFRNNRIIDSNIENNTNVDTHKAARL